MSHYYNEHDPFAAAWLRELIKAGLIPAGYVDERDIREVQPDDVDGYTQAHFFAGIGGWPLALRLAGWPADRSVWTGSCPCQPFSAAGKRKGAADDRHLWPEFRRLVAECSPSVVFGEQVASKDGRLWLSGVRTDLEALDYAVGAADLCAAGVASPHIRQRLYWLADAGNDGCRPGSGYRNWLEAAKRGEQVEHTQSDSGPGRMGNADGAGSFEGRQAPTGTRHGSPSIADGGSCGMGDASGSRLQERSEPQGRVSVGYEGQTAQPPSSLGAWSHFEVVSCADGKHRRFEPSAFPLAHGFSKKLGRVCSSCVAECDREVAAYVASTGTCRVEVLRALREEYGAQKVQRPAGGSGSLPPSAFLLSLLRYLAPTCHRAADDRGGSQEGAQGQAGSVRGMRGYRGVRCSSCGRQRDEQRTAESTDSVRELSRVLARCAIASWSEAVREDAQTLLIGEWPIARVGRLRGYGNAIVPQAAAEFIAAFLDIERERGAA